MNKLLVLAILVPLTANAGGYEYSPTTAKAGAAAVGVNKNHNHAGAAAIGVNKNRSDSESNSRSVSRGGSGYSSSGSFAGADGGTARSGDVDVSTSTTSEVDNNYPVAQAAGVVATICTGGGSLQTDNFGVSINGSSDICTHLMMWQALTAAGMDNLATEHLELASNGAKTKGGMRQFRRVLTLGLLD